jgi:hypothetical protein
MKGKRKALRRLAEGEAAAMRLLGGCDNCRVLCMDALHEGGDPGRCGRCGNVPPTAAVLLLSEAFGYSERDAVTLAETMALVDGASVGGEGDQSVYFLQAGEDGPIKIGVTGNLPQRLRSLEAGCPLPLRVLLVVRAGRVTEQAMHQRFHADRLHHEWFRPSSDLLAYIAGFAERDQEREAIWVGSCEPRRRTRGWRPRRWYREASWAGRGC